MWCSDGGHDEDRHQRSTRRIPHGALLLVSDNPMIPEGVKTADSDRKVTDDYVKKHLEIGIDSLIELRDSGESVKHMRFDS